MDPAADPAAESASESVDAERSERAATGTSAPDPARWYLAPVRSVDPPETGGATEIDRFLNARLREVGLEPVGVADRRTLARRVTFDLTGLPPTPEEVEAFVTDDAPDAWGRLVDRLLASPAYGERWGRHWLDLVRYADTSGDGTDMPLPEAYRYRDYVIRAFQDDLPYDRFVMEQLAGDLLGEETGERVREGRIATGFIALARRYGNGTYSDMHLVIDNTIETVGQAFLAQGVQCARCHDHKFDPITTADYFGWYGYFASTQYPHAGSEHGKERLWLVSLSDDPAAAAAHRAREARKVALKERIAAIDKDAGDAKALEKAAAAREREREDAAEGLLAPPPEAPAATEGGGAILDEARLAALAPAIAARDAAAALRDERKAAEQELPRLIAESESDGELAWAVQDRLTGAGDARIHRAGDPDHPGEVAPRGFLSEIDARGPEIAPGRSGRLALARWIASPDNPLTARVMVNRVWQLHFGRGLVATPNVFGAQGAVPSHPELLDHLADRFVRSGWSVKSLHRDILRSDAYRRAGSDDGDLLARDPDNRWLARFAGRRLAGEAIRDAMLAVSGRLDPTPGGRHPFPKVSKLRFTQHTPFQQDFESDRRSVYLMTRRLGQPPVLDLFDPPDRNRPQGLRRCSTVPQQALFAMNSAFVDRCARSLAERILAEPVREGDLERARGDDERIDAACRFAYQRAASADERALIAEHLGRLGAAEDPRGAWTAVARVLLSSNEFLWVD